MKSERYDTMDTLAHPEHSHKDPAAAAARVIARIPSFDSNFEKTTIADIGSSNLTSNDRSLALHVSKDLLNSLNRNEAAIHISSSADTTSPIIVLDKFVGRLKLEFRNPDAAFIMEKCQNFTMDVLLYAKAFMHIGRLSSCNYCAATIKDGSVIIGDDCMLSHDVTLQPSDQHDILDTETGEIINRRRSVVLGKHVWVGKGGYIGAGVTVGENSIIGAKSVVVSDVPPNTVVAGNPARVIRSGITWSRAFTFFD